MSVSFWGNSLTTPPVAPPVSLYTVPPGAIADLKSTTSLNWTTVPSLIIYSGISPYAAGRLG